MREKIEDDSEKQKDILCSWKNKYFLNDHTAQSSLQILCNPYQNIYDILQRTKINNPKIYMEPEETHNCQSNSEGRKKNKA